MSVSGDRRHSIRARWRPTPLNLATSAAYERCAGSHVASGHFIEREFAVGMRLLSTCVNCEVPITYPGFRYGGSVTVKALLENWKGKR